MQSTVDQLVTVYCKKKNPLMSQFFFYEIKQQTKNYIN